MAIDKLVPRYLNKEDDVRLVKNMEMTDALNVRISADTTGDGGVIKNAYGNSAISFKAGNNWQGKTHALPAGTNKVIGDVADLKDGIVVFFVILLTRALHGMRLHLVILLFIYASK